MLSLFGQTADVLNVRIQPLVLCFSSYTRTSLINHRTRTLSQAIQTLPCIQITQRMVVVDKRRRARVKDSLRTSLTTQMLLLEQITTPIHQTHQIHQGPRSIVYIVIVQDMRLMTVSNYILRKRLPSTVRRHSARQIERQRTLQIH
jgi:hypothetical protein